VDKTKIKEVNKVETQIKMKTVRNKSSPEIGQHYEFYRKILIDRINSIGRFWRVEIMPKNGQNIKSDQSSGLLYDIKETRDSVTYCLINSDGTRVKVKATKSDKVRLVHWRRFIEENWPFQLIPLDKDGRLTFEINKIAKILEITTEKFEKLAHEIREKETRRRK